MNFSEKEYVNRKAVLGHTIIGVVLLAAYLVEFFKGSRTLPYTVITGILFIGPVIAEYIILAQNKESENLFRVMAVCYSIMYLFVIFTTNSLLPFVYIFPLFFLMLLFMQIRECIAVAIVASVGNIAYVAYHALNVGYTSEELPDVEIRLASTVLIAVFLVFSANVVAKVNGEKIKEIEEKTDQTTTLLNRIMQTSDSMMSGISEATGKTEQLGESVEQIHSSMSEVSAGSTETAEAVQLQLQRTEQIQNHIIKVKDTAAAITQNMTETSGKVDVGRTHMQELTEQVEKSMTANNQMLEQMKALSEYTVKMNTIIETITSIANSTGMLALNASIEAARAGEAGKGFAVVATEISALANQTKSATVNITELIHNINNELATVESAVEVVTESNRANAESAQMVTENFAGITQSTENIGGQAEELLNIVGELETANASIVENIQTISAITEEVSAHANETFNACEENARLVEAVTQIVENLDADAQKLHTNG